MKTITFTKDALVIGENALEYLKTLKCKKAVIITGGQSMKKTGVLDKVTNILNQAGAESERIRQHIWFLMDLSS